MTRTDRNRLLAIRAARALDAAGLSTLGLTCDVAEETIRLSGRIASMHVYQAILDALTPIRGLYRIDPDGLAIEGPGMAAQDGLPEGVTLRPRPSRTYAPASAAVLDELHARYVRYQIEHICGLTFELYAETSEDARTGLDRVAQDRLSDARFAESRSVPDGVLARWSSCPVTVLGRAVSIA